MMKVLKDVCIGKEAVSALVSKGKIVGMLIGFSAGAVAGAWAMKCIGKACMCKKQPKKYGNCSIVNEVVDAASKIKSTLDCDCDDEGAGHIPEEEKDDTKE